MNIALPWHPREDRQFGDEYNITFTNKPNNFENLMEFLVKYPDTRFNITIDTSEFSFDFNKLNVLKTIHQKFYIVLQTPNDEKIKFLQENGIKFFFGPQVSIFNFRLLDWAIKQGVTDVYIMDDLCYRLKDVRKSADKEGFSVRLILNEIPSINPDKGSDVRSPIFLPETVDELDKYVDTVEFNDVSWARIEVLYKIWFKKKQWRENLQAINHDLRIEIPNQSMIPDFTIYKMNCGYRCAYGSVCRKCNQFYDMAVDLSNKNIVYNLTE